MALTTSNAKAVNTVAFFEGLTLSVNDDWRKIFDYREDDVSTLRLASLTGVGDVGKWNSGAGGTQAGSTTDINRVTVDSTGAKDLNFESYAVQVYLHKFDQMDIPGIAQMASRKLGQAVAHTYRSLAFGVLGDAFDASAMAMADTKALCSATHTTASGTRSNVLSTALDRSSFLNAMKLGKKWTNYQGQYTNLFDGDVCLVVAPDQEAAALEFLNASYNRGADTTVADATPGSEFGMQANAVRFMNGGAFVDLIVSPHLTANKWFVVSKQETPLRAWSRSAPLYTQHIDPDMRDNRLTVDFAVAFSAGPQSDGIVGADV